MKVVLKNVGGPSPGITIVGERASLLKLADSLRTNVGQVPEGKEVEIPFADSAACGGGSEWISVQVVSDIGPAMKVELKKGKRLSWGIWAILGSGLAILVLAYLGLMSLLR
jgi:hypothetical protein